MKFIATLLFVVSFAANANECAQEAKKYCSGVEPGKGQLARCLSDYEANLSPKCKADLAEYKKTTGKKNPCFEDLAEFCADLPSDPLNYEYCLLKHESRLSPKCSADFKQKKGRIITRNVCAQDVAYNCYSAISGPEGSMTKCLIKNKPKLTMNCQKNIDKRVAEMKKKNPCFDDQEKFCPTAVRFVEIQDCLSKKSASLQPNCKKVVDKESEKLKANPCYRDLITHCRAGIPPKEQHECLTLNEEHLSRSCKEFRVTEKTKVDNMVKFCEADRLKLCKSEPFKDGKVVKCLRKNKEKVSPQCKSLL